MGIEGTYRRFRTLAQVDGSEQGLRPSFELSLLFSEGEKLVDFQGQCVKFAFAKAMG